MSATSDAAPLDCPPSTHKRRYASACLGCKTRKLRCDDPENRPCKACRASGAECIDPPKTRPRKERPVAEVQVTSTSPASSSQQYNVEERLQRLEKFMESQLRSHSPDHSASDREREITPPRFSLQGRSYPIYHGETSMHEDGQVLADGGDPELAAASLGLALDISTWTETQIRQVTRLRHKYASPEDGESLMDAYFCWASPTYAVVNRGIFLRDMAIQGPYFSDMLLLVMYTSGLRFSPAMDPQERDIKSGRYIGLIMGMVANEMCQQSSIPRIQAFLSLAARQVAVGEKTQAWLFTGVAIRMIQDLGIHLAIDNPDLDASLPQEDREMRVRLYWSAYCWDKTLALGLGRETALTCRPDVIPEVHLNEGDDVWTWKPCFPGRPDAYVHYPPATLQSNVFLRHFSHLNLLVESVLVNMYSPHRPNARSRSFILATYDKVGVFWRDLPPSMKIDQANPPTMCPPISITVLNLLYHAIIILLHRPLLSERTSTSGEHSSVIQTCRTAAVDIHAIMSLWGATFGVRNIVYLMMYATFLAAGVDVVLLRLGTPQIKADAAERIQLSLAILEQASAQGPGIKKGIEIITAQLGVAGQMTGVSPSNNPFTSVGLDSSLRGIPPRSFTFEGASPAGTAFRQSVSSVRDHLPAPSQSACNVLEDCNMPFLGTESSEDFLANLLGSSDVDTNDPFAFLTSDSWYPAS